MSKDEEVTIVHVDTSVTYDFLAKESWKNAVMSAAKAQDELEEWMARIIESGIDLNDPDDILALLYMRLQDISAPIEETEGHLNELGTYLDYDSSE